MHSEPLRINIDEAIRTEPIRQELFIQKLMWLCLSVGGLVFTVGLMSGDQAHFWGVFYINAIFWMGLACGGVMIAVIAQIVRATWISPVRRIAEANVAYLPYAFLTFLLTYLGKDVLFPWARAPMPGREWWMEPGFVYGRFAVMFGLLFFMMTRFVNMSLRGDIGLLKETMPKAEKLYEWPYAWLIRNWRGSRIEVPYLQNKMSWNGPLLVLVYAVVYSLFAFEMIMGMDTIWYSNMFGGFIFLGNIYLAWAVTGILTVFFASRSPAYRKTVTTNQLWDLGKLTFGFTMLWGYTFFSQFLPQWYGNLPEETQWLILRTREFPWKGLAWVTFSMCFILPFILFSGEDVKKNPTTFATVCFIPVFGLWLEKYMVIMPQLIPGHIPFGVLEVGMFLGFMGAYALSIFSFMSKYPFIPISHPQTRNSVDW